MVRDLKAKIWDRDDLDYYVEPEWTSARLFCVEPFFGRQILDPACGSGRIVRAARAAGLKATGSDIVKRTAQCRRTINYLDSKHDDWLRNVADNIVCNPPFSLAREFVDRSLDLGMRRMAMLLPVRWLLGDRRSRWLENTPLIRVWLLTPRPSMPPGKLIEDGVEPTGGRVDFAWYVWDREIAGVPPQIGWLRKNLMLRKK